MNNHNDLEQARQDLDQAKETHVAALVACLSAPDDPEAVRAVKQAALQGRGAWKGYREAATAGLAAQIDGIVPSELRGE